MSATNFLELGDSLGALVATPEKALLDLIYLTSGGDYESYIRSLRIQNLENLDLQSLRNYAEHFEKPKLRRAADNVELLILEAFGVEEGG